MKGYATFANPTATNLGTMLSFIHPSHTVVCIQTYLYTVYMDNTHYIYIFTIVIDGMVC